MEFESFLDSDLKCIVHCSGESDDNFTFLLRAGEPDVRFSQLLEVKATRQAQPVHSPYRLDEACRNLPESFEEISKNHGYHRSCYQKFTKNLDRIRKPAKRVEETVNDGSGDGAKRQRRDLEPYCKFCHKTGRKYVRKRGDRRSEELIQLNSDYFHRSCQKVRPESEITVTSDHGVALEDTVNFVHSEVVTKGLVVSLRDATHVYVQSLSSTENATPSYRPCRVKDKLMSSVIGNDIMFCSINSTANSVIEIIMPATSDVAAAVQIGYNMGREDRAFKTCTDIRQDILDAYSKADSDVWPLTAETMESTPSTIPDSLVKLLSYIIGGSEDVTEKTRRLVSSFAQDVCRAVTNGRWKLPKHVALCMVLRHLFRSSLLTKILNRLGHSEDYCFGLELETALAQSIDHASYALPQRIITDPAVPSIVHSVFDNFDSYIKSLNGAGSIHLTHGAVLQQLCAPIDPNSHTQTLPAVQRTKKRSLEYTNDESLEPCFISKATRRSPARMRYTTCPEASNQSGVDRNRRVLMWLLTRIHAEQSGAAIVPDLFGRASQVGSAPPVLTTVDYYPAINNPFTKPETLKKCLQLSEQSCDSVNQLYPICTFDLGGCMVALPLVWTLEPRFERHIILPGTMHITMAAFKMLGKKLTGSGADEILMEAGLCSCGSLRGVKNGQNLYRCQRCHQTLSEAMQHLLIASFMRDKGAQSLSELLSETQRQLLQQSMTYDFKKSDEENLVTSLEDLLDEVDKYTDRIEAGEMGKTAQFWSQYIKHYRSIELLQCSIRENNYDLYVYALFELTPLFFGYGGQNYARYLSYFSAFLANVEDTHPGATDLLRRGAISVTRSTIPSSRTDVDKTAEETIMKHAKSHSGPGSSGAGLSGIMTNPAASRRWLRATHERVKYYEFLQTTVGLQHAHSNSHRLRPSEMASSAQRVRDTKDAITSFLDPFDTPNPDRLYVLSSGSPIDDEAAEDILNADAKGVLLRNQFISSTLSESGNHDANFYDAIPRPKGRTFQTKEKVMRGPTKAKLAQFTHSTDIAYKLLFTMTSEAMKSLMRYPLMSVPPALATPDGFLLKTNKSLLLHFLVEKQRDAPYPDQSRSLHIEDGNALFYQLRDMPATYEEVALQLLAVTSSKRSYVVFSTDMYHPSSIKGSERRMRGEGKRYVVKPAMKRPDMFSRFLANDQNKQDFCRVMLKTWTSDKAASALEGKTVGYICDGLYHEITVPATNSSPCTTRIFEMDSSQEETDTRVVLYLSMAKRYNLSTVVVHSPDSDIFFILLHYVHTIPDLTVLYDTKIRGERRLLNVTEIGLGMGAKRTAAWLGLHCFTRCDYTSAFRGIGKKKPAKKLMKYPEFMDALASLGTQSTVTAESSKALEAFTCKLYRDGRVTSLDELRYRILEERIKKSSNASNGKCRKIDITSLPPPATCLHEHINRTNLAVLMWKSAHQNFPELPRPTEGHGWRENEEGHLEPLWFAGPVAPSDWTFATDSDSSDDDEGCSESCASDSMDSDDD